MRRRTLKNRCRLWFARRANRHHLSILLRLLISLIFIFGFIFGIAHLPLITVRTVHITPDSDITDILQKEILTCVNKELNTYTYGIPGSVRHFFNKEKIETMLREKFLSIKTADIEKKFFNEWHITVEKRETFGTACTETNCLLIDTSGLIFGKTPMIKVGHPVTFVGDGDIGDYLFTENTTAENQNTGAEDFQKIEKIIDFLKKEELFIDNITIQQGNRDIYIKLENGIGIWIDTTENVWDITRLLHIAFSDKVFTEEEINFSSIVICDPFNLYWTPDVQWKKGCGSWGE